MPEERRRAPRARITGARIRYEGASGERHSGRALDLSSGGVFVETSHPTAVGKRISLEIQVAGELAPWPALGRVIWARQYAGGGQPPAGMGVAFIDLEDAVRLAIERVLRVLLARGASNGQPSPPVTREATVLGVGPAKAEVPRPVASPVVPPRPAAPVVPAPAPAPAVLAVKAGPPLARENTVLGVGAAPPAAQGAALARAARPSDGTVTAAMPAITSIPAEALREDSVDEAGWDEVEPGVPPEPPPPAPAPASPLIKAVEVQSFPKPAPAPPAPEASVALDLVAKRPPDPEPLELVAKKAVSHAPAKVEEPPPVAARLAPEPEPKAPEEREEERESEDSLVPAGVPRRGAGGRLALVVLVALVAGGYVQRERLRPFVGPYIQKAMAMAGASTPAPPAAAPASPPPIPAAPPAPPVVQAAAAPASAASAMAPQSSATSPSASGAAAPAPAKSATPAATAAVNAPSAAAPVASNAPPPQPAPAAAKANARRPPPATPGAPRAPAAGGQPAAEGSGNPDNPY